MSGFLQNLVAYFSVLESFLASNIAPLTGRKGISTILATVIVIVVVVVGGAVVYYFLVVTPGQTTTSPYP